METHHKLPQCFVYPPLFVCLFLSLLSQDVTSQSHFGETSDLGRGRGTAQPVQRSARFLIVSFPPIKIITCISDLSAVNYTESRQTTGNVTDSNAGRHLRAPTVREMTPALNTKQLTFKAQCLLYAPSGLTFRDLIFCCSRRSKFTSLHIDGRLVNSLRLRCLQRSKNWVFKYKLVSSQFSLIKRTNGQSLGTFQRAMFYRKSQIIG